MKYFKNVFKNFAKFRIFIQMLYEHYWNIMYKKAIRLFVCPNNSYFVHGAHTCDVKSKIPNFDPQPAVSSSLKIEFICFLTNFRANLDEEKYSFETVVCEENGRKRRKVIFSDAESNEDEVKTDDGTDSDQSEESGDDVGDEDDEKYDFNDEIDGSDDDTDESDINQSKIEKDKVGYKMGGAKNESEISEETSALKWKENLSQKAADAFIARQNTTANLWKLVYGSVLYFSKF